MRIEDYDARRVFKENLNRYMHERGIDQAYIADKIGKTASTVSDWVLGKKYPRVDAMQQLAKILGVTIEDLTGRREQKWYGPIVSAYLRADIPMRKAACASLGIQYFRAFDDKELIWYAHGYIIAISQGNMSKETALKNLEKLFKESQNAAYVHYSNEMYYKCIEAIDSCNIQFLLELERLEDEGSVPLELVKDPFFGSVDSAIDQTAGTAEDSQSYGD